MLKRHRRRIFEEGRRQVRLTDRLKLFGQLCHLQLRNHLAVHANPLSKLHEMGRGIEPHSIPCRLQYRGGHGRSGALSVRPGDMQRAVLGLRHPESPHQRRHRLETQLDAMLLQAKEKGHGRQIGHGVIRQDGRLARMRHRGTRLKSGPRACLRFLSIACAPRSYRSCHVRAETLRAETDPAAVV